MIDPALCSCCAKAACCTLPLSAPIVPIACAAMGIPSRCGCSNAGMGGGGPPAIGVVYRGSADCCRRTAEVAASAAALGFLAASAGSMYA